MLVVCTKLLLLMSEVDTNRQLIRQGGTVGLLLDRLAYGNLELAKNVRGLIYKCWCTRMALLRQCWLLSLRLTLGRLCRC